MLSHNDLFRVDITSGLITRITSDTLNYEEICVSPNGKKIAYHGKIKGGDQIFTIDINGKNRQQITSADAYHGEPEWIPSTRKSIFPRWFNKYNLITETWLYQLIFQK